MNDSQEQWQARRRAGAKLGFYIHFTVYVLVNLLLVAINLVTNPERLWCLWPLCGWGVGLFFHGTSVFLGGALLERMTEHELDKKRVKK